MLIEQFVFISSLYLLGLLFALLFYPKISAIFACLTGFLWGTLIYVLFVIIILATHLIPYNVITTIIFEVLTLITFIILLVSNKNSRIRNIGEILFIAGFSVTLFLVVFFFSFNNFTKSTLDSVILVDMGKNIASGEFYTWSVGSPKGYSLLIPILHSSSSFFGGDYYSSLQPTFSFVLACILIFGISNFLKPFIAHRLIRGFASLLSTLIFFVTPIVLFKTTYLHTNLISAIYLFVAIISFWNTRKKESSTYISLGLISLIGFGFCRTENSLFGIVILLFMFCLLKLPYRKRIMISIPYVVVFVIWWALVLLMKSTPFTDILSNTTIYAYIGIFLSFMIGIIVSNQKWLEKNVLFKLHYWIPLLFTLAFLVMLAIKPDNMFSSLRNLIGNLFINQNGGYGFTNYFIAIGFLIIPVIRIMKKDKTFQQLDYLALMIYCFFLFVLLLGSFRTPYRLGWSDSANRMIVEILPFAITFIIVEMIHLSSGIIQNDNSTSKADTNINT